MIGRISCKCLHSSSLLRKLLILAGVSLLAVQGSFAHDSPTVQMKSAAAAESSPAVMLTPEAVRFADVPVGDTYTQTVRITNLGEETIQIKKIISSRAEFSVSGILLPVVVAHGTSESFTIAYKAVAEGSTEGQISIVTSSGSAPMMLKVKGSAAEGQMELTASEADMEFADVAVGTSSKKELLLTNSGNRDLTVSAILVSGGGFSVSGSTGARLSPGQSIGVDVSFTPKNLGMQTGRLMVSGVDGSSLLTIPLSAIGAASSQSTVKLNWEESPVTVAGYVVYRSAESSGPYMRISSAAVPTAEFVDTGLAAGHTYYYVVKSLDGDEGESEESAPIAATIPEG